MGTVLVTGSSGLLGAQVAADLLAGSRQVVGLDLASPPNDLVAHPQFSVVIGDITDYSEVFRTIKQSDVSQIVHAGGISHPAPSLRSPVQTVNVIVGGIMAILEAARFLEVGRVVFLSSVAVYDEASQDLIREDDRTEGNSPYGVAKRAAELLGLQYAKLYGIDFVALRPTLIYGPRRQTPEPIRMLIEHAKAGRSLNLPSGADGFIQCIYVEDCSRAVLIALDAPSLRHRMFNVGTGTRHTLGEVAQLINDYIPGSLLEIGPGMPGPELAELRLERRERGVISIERISQELQWEPRYTLEAGLRRYIDAAP